MLGGYFNKGEKAMNEDCYPITHHRKWWQFWKPKCWIEWVNIEDSKIKVITKGKD